MGNACNILFSFLLTLFFGAGVALCLSWSADSRLFPLLLSSVGTFLSLCVVIGECKKAASLRVGAKILKVLRTREMLIILWVAAFLILLMLFGFYPAIALHTPVFLLYYGSESRKTAATLTVSMWLATYLIFNNLLKIPLYTGLLGVY